MTHEYLFDIRLNASVRVKAESEAEARKMLDAEIDCSEANLGAWPNGDPILCEVSLDEDGEPDLVAIDDVFEPGC